MFTHFIRENIIFFMTKYRNIIFYNRQRKLHIFFFDWIIIIIIKIKKIGKNRFQHFNLFTAKRIFRHQGNVLKSFVLRPIKYWLEISSYVAANGKRVTFILSAIDTEKENELKLFSPSSCLIIDIIKYEIVKVNSSNKLL